MLQQTVTPQHHRYSALKYFTAILQLNTSARRDGKMYIMSAGDDRRRWKTWDITLTHSGLSLEKKAASAEMLDVSRERR